MNNDVTFVMITRLYRGAAVGLITSTFADVAASGLVAVCDVRIV